jgi:FkbM family methyltransferase
VERQLTSTKGLQLGRLERIFSSAARTWNRSAPLYLRYGIHFFLGAAGRMSVEADGARFTVRPRSFDLYILREIFEGRVYEPRRRLSAQPRLVVDLGANIGAFSVWAGMRWSPEKIVAVEMEPENFTLLQENVGDNLGKQVLALQAAIWDCEGSVRIRRHPINTGMHEVLPEAGEMEVPSLTLRSLLAAAGADRIDFLKVDIEGAEARLFTPANAELFSTRVRRVAAELHPNKGVEVDEIVRYLGAAGFEAEIRKQPTNRAVMMEAVNRELR